MFSFGMLCSESYTFTAELKPSLAVLKTVYGKIDVQKVVTGGTRIKYHRRFTNNRGSCSSRATSIHALSFPTGTLSLSRMSIETFIAMKLWPRHNAAKKEKKPGTPRHCVRLCSHQMTSSMHARRSRAAIFFDFDSRTGLSELLPLTQNILEQTSNSERSISIIDVVQRRWAAGATGAEQPLD